MKQTNCLEKAKLSYSVVFSTNDISNNSIIHVNFIEKTTFHKPYSKFETESSRRRANLLGSLYIRLNSKLRGSF